MNYSMKKRKTNVIYYSNQIHYIANEDPKDSRIINKPSNDDLVMVKSSEINLNIEIMKYKSEIKLLSEISTFIMLCSIIYKQSFKIVE